MDSILNSSGYVIRVGVSDYNNLSVGDLVKFEKCYFDEKFLTGTIIRRCEYPRLQYRHNQSLEIEYTLIVRLNATVELNIV